MYGVHGTSKIAIDWTSSIKGITPSPESQSSAHELDLNWADSLDII